MLKDLALKLGIVLMIVVGAFFFWYDEGGREQIGEDVEQNITGLIPVNASKIIYASGLAEENFCPFINPYMSQLFSSGYLELPVDSTIHNAFESVLGDCETPIPAVYNYDKEKYVLSCGESSVELSADDLAAILNEYAKTQGLPMFINNDDEGNPQLIKGWQCLFFFGILPFVTMFLFLKDILAFTLFSPKVKNLVAIFASLIAIFTGTFAEFVWQLSYMAAFSVQGTFLVLMLIMGFLSVIMSWIGSISGAVGASRRESAELAAGIARKVTDRALLDMGREED